MTDLDAIVGGLIGTAVMEQAPLPLHETGEPWASGFLDAHDLWVRAMVHGIARGWRREDPRWPAQGRTARGMWRVRQLVDRAVLAGVLVRESRKHGALGLPR